MLNFINNVLLTPYVQAVLFFLLVGLFFLQRRKATFFMTSLGWVRTITLLILFLYFAWNWASEIPSSLRTASVIGMFCVNLSMLYNLILGNLEEKYWQALENYARAVDNKALLDRVWATGQRFLQWRFFPEAILSGHAPGTFLQGIINHQIPADLKRTLAKHGVAAEVITHKNLLAFLAKQLDQSTIITGELKAAIAQHLKQFAEHAWLQEQVDAFLHLAVTDPKKLTGLTWPEPPQE